MTSSHIEQTIADVRSAFGPQFVPARQEAEDAARQMLDARIGEMTTEDITRLGRLFNQHNKAGRVRYDRFSPGFAGAIMDKLGEDTARFNRVVTRLWRDPEDQALELLGNMYADRSILPGAGSSLPSYLLYLRNPQRYGVCINATMRGLAVHTGVTYRADGRGSYQRFCTDLLRWRQQYGVAPQEADVFLTVAMRNDRLRRSADPDEQDPADVAGPAALDTDRLTVEQVASRAYLSVEQVDQWVQALHTGMRQAVFHGPPGTGKTYVSRLLARHLASSPNHIELVQFHPAYSYEDFVEGLRPQAGNGGGLTYDIRDGLFTKLCDRAAAAPNETFVLVVDEMNRADLAAVFGELLFLLEYRGDSPVALPYSQRRLSVPPNLILLGTMNTADRSLALLDFALRRRFHALPLQPSAKVLEAWAATRPAVNAELALGVFRLIRDRVGHDAPVSPGHSYWMIEGLDAAAAERVWSYQLRPYLAEHWFERPAELNQLDADVRALIAERA